MPDVLPNGRAMLFTISSAGTIAEAFVLDLQTRERGRLFQGALAKYVGSGHVLYQSGDGASLMAVPFDQERLDVTGPARSVVEGIWADIPGHFAVSESGHLAYVPLEESLSVAGGPARQLVWVERSGTEEPVDPSLEAQGFQTIALSPDDDRVAITILRPSFENLWVKELPSGPLTRLTPSEEAERPVWSRDGRTIAYIHIVDGDGTARARTIRSDGSSAGATELLLRRSETSVREVVFTPDERGLLFREGAAIVGVADIGFVDLETGEVNDSLLATPFNERAIDLSPDGRWLAYVSDISGRDEVYVRPFPATDTARWQVSTDGGGEPLWAHNGSELFYRERVTGFAGRGATSGSMMVATYVTDPEFEIRDRDVLFDASPYFAVDSHWRYYDVTSDDQRFLMIRSVGENANSRIVFVQNFVETLRGEMPG